MGTSYVFSLSSPPVALCTPRSSDHQTIFFFYPCRQALRAAFDPRVQAGFCYFATDVHSSTLGNKPDDSLVRIARGDLGEAEVGLVFGRQDTHVDLAGRSLIRATLEEGRSLFSVRLTLLFNPKRLSVVLTASLFDFEQFYEVQAQHAFIRDTSSKGRWDAALSRSLFGVMMELFERTVGRDLGPRRSAGGKLEHVC